MSVGTDWADAVDNISCKISDSELSSGATDDSWATVVSHGSTHMAKANTHTCTNMNLNAGNPTGDGGAKDFVILHTQERGPAFQTLTGRHGSRSTPLRGGLSSFGGAEIQHKAVVEPIFLAYNWVSTETRHTLM